MKFYELTDSRQNADITISEGLYNLDKTFLKEVQLQDRDRDTVLSEAAEWAVMEHVARWFAIYAYQHYQEGGHLESSDRECTDYSILVKDGHYHGAVIRKGEVPGFEMQGYQDNDYGLLLIDGTSKGAIKSSGSSRKGQEEHFASSQYSLVRKADEN